jgi:hypothetical protein
MNKVLDFINGKKTYIVAVIAAATAVAQALGFTIPEWVYTLEVAAGLGAVRIAIGKTDA